MTSSLSSTINLPESPETASDSFRTGIKRIAQGFGLYTPCKDDSICIEPFRLLDLPKEIRLLIYEKLEINWTRHPIPLNMYGYRATLINASLAGVCILATSRFISDEAGSILRPRLSRMLATPPTMLVAAEHLVALSGLHYRIDLHRNTLHTIIAIVNNPVALRTIDAFRQGLCGIKYVRRYLHFDDRITDEDVRAIAFFILRTAKFVATDYSTPNAHPPVAVVIQLPAWYTSTTIHYRTPRIVRLWYKYIARRTSPITYGRQFILSVIVESLAYRALQRCLECRKSPVSITVMLQFTDPVDDYRDMSLDESNVRVSVDLGVMRVANAGARKLVSYGGVYEDEEAQSLEERM